MLVAIVNFPLSYFRAHTIVRARRLTATAHEHTKQETDSRGDQHRLAGILTRILLAVFRHLSEVQVFDLVPNHTDFVSHEVTRLSGCFTDFSSIILSRLRKPRRRLSGTKAAVTRGGSHSCSGAATCSCSCCCIVWHLNFLL